MDEQTSKPIFTGRPPGKKLPQGLTPAEIIKATPEAVPVAAPVEVPTHAEVSVPVEMPAPVEVAPVAVTLGEPKPASTAAASDRRRHAKTLAAAAILVATFGAIFGSLLATVVKPSAAPPSVRVADAGSNATDVVTPQVDLEPVTKSTTTPTSASKPTPKPTPSAPESVEEDQTTEPEELQMVSYNLQETQNCHAKVSAELQVLTDGEWVFSASPDGWARVVNCPDSNPFQPYVTKVLLEGTTVRWLIYSSDWQWKSRPQVLY